MVLALVCGGAIGCCGGGDCWAFLVVARGVFFDWLLAWGVFAFTGLGGWVIGWRFLVALDVVFLVVGARTFCGGRDWLVLLARGGQWRGDYFLLVLVWVVLAVDWRELAGDCFCCWGARGQWRRLVGWCGGRLGVLVVGWFGGEIGWFLGRGFGG